MYFFGIIYMYFYVFDETLKMDLYYKNVSLKFSLKDWNTLKNIIEFIFYLDCYNIRENWVVVTNVLTSFGQTCYIKVYL